MSENSKSSARLHRDCSLGTRAERQMVRRDRLDLAIASVKSLLSFMPRAMQTVEFRSRLSPPMDEAEIREIFQAMLDRSAELWDAAEGFKCFCDCQYDSD